MIPGYQRGSDITILDTIYFKPQKDSNGKYSKDVMTIIYRDNQLGVKKHIDITEPDYKFFMANENVKIDHSLMYIEEDKVSEHVVPYRTLDKSVAEITGNLSFYYDNIKSGNYGNNKMIHSNVRLFGTDEHVEDHYRKRFAETYKNEPYNISKSFLDIEVDIIDMPGEANIGDHYGDYPINAVTLIDDSKNKVYTFVLRNKENPLIQEFENYVATGAFKPDIKEFVKENVGGWKAEKRFGIDQYDYNIFFYDIEIDLLAEIFQIINYSKPDFILAWNMAFDIPYIIERIKYLGYDPADIIGHPDFKNKIAYYYIDEFHQNEFKSKGDYAKISSYTVYVDQLIQYASRRKGQSEPPNYRLDTIGDMVAGVRKLDYSHITTDIAELPYKDFKVFIFYNIMDTMVQKCIEKKTEDLNYLFFKTLINNIRYNKCHRNTIYLTNRGIKEFRTEDHLIMGNNPTRYKPKPPSEKFMGALVSQPELADYDSMIDNGEIPIRIFRNGNDFDFSAMYPSITHQFNISAPTMVGRINIPEKVQENENPFGIKFYIREGQFIEDLQSQNYIDFCQRWFNFAGFSDLLDDIQEYILNYSHSATFVNWNNSIYTNPMRINENTIYPMKFNKDKIMPMVIRNPFNKDNFKDLFNEGV